MIHTQFTISPFESSADTILNGLGNLTLDEASGKRAESLVEDIVARVADRELESINLDVYILDTEQALLRRLGVVDNGDGGGDTTSTEEDVSKTGVFDFLVNMLV
jgi:hypothetical protein